MLWNCKPNIFWKETQQGLLISDKQTKLYEQGDDQLKRYLTHLAWGRD